MVTKEEGLAFAEESGCLFLESSAKTRENVEKCFEELALKVCLEKDIRHRNVIHLKPFFLLRGRGGGRWLYFAGDWARSPAWIWAP